MQLAWARSWKAPVLQPIGLKQHHSVALFWGCLCSVQVATVWLPGQAGLQSRHRLSDAVQGAAFTCPDADCGVHPCREAEGEVLLLWQLGAVFLPSASWHWTPAQLLRLQWRHIKTTSSLLDSLKMAMGCMRADALAEGAVSTVDAVSPVD